MAMYGCFCMCVGYVASLCVSLCIYVYVYVCVCLYAYGYLHVCPFVCMSVCVCLQVCLCVYVCHCASCHLDILSVSDTLHLFICLYVVFRSVGLCMSVDTCGCVCICVYVYIAVSVAVCPCFYLSVCM